MVPPTPTNESNGLNPSILIIALLLALVVLLSASIHLILRYLDRRCLSSTSDLRSQIPATAVATSHSLSNRRVSPEHQALIDALPLFPFSSVFPSAAASGVGGGGGGVHKDCAVCLAHFEPHDRLRLLPSCSHAFHQPCIDTWLASNRTCPLCRSTIDVEELERSGKSEPGSFRVEIGSVSRRESVGDSRRRSYSVGSFDYILDDEADVAVSAASGNVERGAAKDVNGEILEPEAPGDYVAEAAGERGWLKDYMDRLASSASSSFSSRTMSIRFSGRFSGRFSAGAMSRRRSGSWDLEGNGTGEEEGGYSNFFRWLSGI